MSTKDQAWAERVGREAVDLGFPCVTRMRSSVGCVGGFVDIYEAKHGLAKTETWPDFRDRLTELACIAWVEDVARGAYSCHIRFTRRDDNLAIVEILNSCVDDDMQVMFTESATTLAEACIAAVRAMKGGE